MTDAETIITLAELGPGELRSLGNGVLAYTRPATGDVEGVAIHGADGTLLGVAPTLAHAIVAIRTEGMELASIH